MAREGLANFQETTGHVSTLIGTSALVGGEYLTLNNHDISGVIGAEIGLLSFVPLFTASWLYNKARAKRNEIHTSTSFEKNKRLDNNRNSILSLGLLASSIIAATSAHNLPQWASYGLEATTLLGAGGFAWNATRSTMRTRDIRR